MLGGSAYTILSIVTRDRCRKEQKNDKLIKQPRVATANLTHHQNNGHRNDDDVIEVIAREGFKIPIHVTRYQGRAEQRSLREHTRSYVYPYNQTRIYRDDACLLSPLSTLQRCVAEEIRDRLAVVSTPDRLSQNG